MKKNVEIINYQLYIDKQLIKLPFPAYEFLIYNNGIVVLMNTKPNECRDNIFFVNEDGTIRWQIEPFAYVEKPGYSGYTSVFERNGELHAFMFDGFDCHIDPMTGKILDKVFVK